MRQIINSNPAIGPAPGLTEMFRYMSPRPSFVFRQEIEHGFDQFHSLTAGEQLYNNWTHPEEETFISKDQWEQEYHRPGLNFREGMSLAEADIARERHDKDFRYELMSQNSYRGWDTILAGVSGLMLTQALDPVNYIPIAGWMTKARYARNAGTAATGGMLASAGFVGTEAFVTELARESVFAARDTSESKDYNVTQGALNLGLAFGIGAGFGFATKGIMNLRSSDHFVNFYRSGISRFDNGQTLPDAAVIETPPGLSNAPNENIELLPSTKVPEEGDGLGAQLRRDAKEAEAQWEAHLQSEDPDAYTQWMANKTARTEQHDATERLIPSVVQFVKNCVKKARGA